MGWRQVWMGGLGRASLQAALALALTLPSGCGAHRWALVNVTDSEATVIQDRDVHREGARVDFISAVLEHEPRVMAGRSVDYWTQKTTVDCSARTYQLGDIVAFNASGDRLATDAGLDPAKPLRPGSIEATEADDVCRRSAGLPEANAGGLTALLHDFRTGSVLPGVRPAHAS